MLLLCLNFNHKEKYNEFEKKKKELEESRKTKRPAQGGDAGPAPKKAKEDFFKNPSDMDRDLDRRSHEALISHMAETCTPFHQYGESFQQLISVANKRIKVKSRFTLSRMITRKAEEVRHEIATIIASVEFFSVGLIVLVKSRKADHEIQKLSPRYPKKITEKSKLNLLALL